MQQHVRVLILWPLGSVSLGIGIRGDMERIGSYRIGHMVPYVFREARIDFVEHILPVEQRPHLANGLVTDPGHDAVNIVQHGIDRQPLGSPIVTSPRKFGTDRVALTGARIDIGHDILRGCFVRQVVDAGANVDDRLERGMRGHIGDPLAAHVDLAAIPQRLAVFLTGADHVTNSLRR